MQLKIGKLIGLNVFDLLDKGARQIIFPDHVDESRIGIACSKPPQSSFPLAAIAQAHAHGAAFFFDENLFDVVHGANLTAAWT